MAGCATENGGTSINGDSSIYSFRGNASWYQYGTRTASGEKFDTNNGMTIAHKTLPFGTKVKLTNLENNKTVIATVNDRGPFIPGRVVDTTKKIALLLEFLNKGIAPVQVDVLIK